MSKEKGLLQALAVDHPYYCSESNYYSNEAYQEYDTMTDFLSAFEGMDVDMNLIFRWDVYKIDDESYSCHVYMMLQRKGIFIPHYIERVTEEEAEKFIEYLKIHWARLQEMWLPISEVK